MDSRSEDGADYDRAEGDRGSVCSTAATGLSTLSSRIASLAADFGDRLRPGIAEGNEFLGEGGEEDEEEIVELTEEQVMQELDKQEPAFQVCSRLFRSRELEGVHLKRLKLEHIEHLQQHGFVRLDGFLVPEAAVRLRSDTLVLKRQGRLHEPQRVAPSFAHNDRFTERSARGDQILWLHARRAPATVYSFASLLTMLQEVQEDLAQLMKLKQTSPEFQLSVYPSHGAQYVRHRDAFPDDGGDESQRKVTAIVYANPGWSASDGGKLRLWLPKTQPHGEAPSGAHPGALPPSAPHLVANGHLPQPGLTHPSSHTSSNTSSASHAAASGGGRPSVLSNGGRAGQHNGALHGTGLGNGHASSLVHGLANGLANGHSVTSGSSAGVSQAAASQDPSPLPGILSNGSAAGPPGNFSQPQSRQQPVAHHLSHSTRAGAQGAEHGTPAPLLAENLNASRLENGHAGSYGHMRSQGPNGVHFAADLGNGHAGNGGAAAAAAPHHLAHGGSEELISEAPSTPHAAGSSILADQTSDQALSEHLHPSDLGHHSGSLDSGGVDAPEAVASGSADGHEDSTAAGLRRLGTLRDREVADVLERTEVGLEPVVDIAPLAGRLVLFLSGAVEHAVLPNFAERVAVTAWFQ